MNNTITSRLYTKIVKEGQEEAVVKTLLDSLLSERKTIANRLREVESTIDFILQNPTQKNVETLCKQFHEWRSTN